MQIVDYRQCAASELEDLCYSVFAESENAAEGRMVSKLVRQLTGDTPEQDVQGWVAVDDAGPVGLVFFSRLRIGERPDIVLLSPLAVRSTAQKTGIGRALVDHAREQLKAEGIAIITTYGDPAYYQRLGFQPLPQSVLPAPHELSFPEGWMGLSLSEEDVPEVAGDCVCVKAFDDPLYW
ncbi:N-acetyltransferase [Halomonas sp. 18H]|uniref:GNAT family N-acetyltransferase n=1 Tax=Halomonas almeriensis TaxID=308163 RepID=UPI00222EE905|nr:MULTISPECIES: N-acetyltransferase [Halomonas]MCW4152787.1 N-acetyltransferase [Halomonas sp. 18H]MDN3552013.1 N-acetyltransferase [Halomonas almeriensis]